MCDEKWFHSLVPRSNAKACEELGIMKQSYSAHHKKHIAKVMVHCTVNQDGDAGGVNRDGRVHEAGDGERSRLRYRR
jgi:hypothetical protein